MLPLSVASIGFGVWALVLHSRFSDTVTEDTDQCQGSTMLQLLFAFALVNIISAGVSLAGQCCKIAEVAIFGQQLVLSLCTACVRLLSGLAAMVLLIIVCVMLWGGQCDTQQSDLYKQLQGYMVAQIVVHIVVTVVTVCMVRTTIEFD